VKQETSALREEPYEVVPQEPLYVLFETFAAKNHMLSATLCFLYRGSILRRQDTALQVTLPPCAR
jgi:hypothetical protein